MPDNSNISIHAQNISSAIFRVCTLVRHAKLREELEGAAISLVVDISEERMDTLRRLLGLAYSVGEMNETNTSVLLRELGNLEDMVLRKIAELPDASSEINVEKFFSSAVQGAVSQERKSEIRSKNIHSEDRQTAILSFIRQFPNDCRMKDLVAEFSNVSERTLRTDVQKLVHSGHVERLGAKSGPFSYFRAVEVSDAQSGADTQFAEGESADGTPYGGGFSPSDDQILLPEATTSLEG